MALDTIRSLLGDDPRYVERIEGSKCEFAGRIFQVETLDVRMPDGSTSWREILRHNGGAGVCVVRDGQICLVRQYRVALERMTLEIPAGKLDPGEDPAVCAERELEEETGLVADYLTPIAVSAGAPGFNNEKTRIFAAHGVRQGEARPDAGEFVEEARAEVESSAEAVGKWCEEKRGGKGKTLLLVGATKRQCWVMEVTKSQGPNAVAFAKEICPAESGEEEELEYKLYAAIQTPKGALFTVGSIACALGAYYFLGQEQQPIIALVLAGLSIFMFVNVK